MPIAYWNKPATVLIFCLSPAAGQERIPLPQGGAASLRRYRDQITLTVTPSGHGPMMLVLQRDPSISRKARSGRLEILRQVGVSTLVIRDTHPSTPGGMSHCQAGEESFLRIIDWSDGTLRERLKLKLESCIDSLELATDGLHWSEDGTVLDLTWLASSPETPGPWKTLRLSFAPPTPAR